MSPRSRRWASPLNEENPRLRVAPVTIDTMLITCIIINQLMHVNLFRRVR